jgi:hypothetical protein
MRSFGFALLTSALAIAALPAAAPAQSEKLKLPAIGIDAPNGIVDDPKRPATMRVYDRRRRETYNGDIGIELRGFTSQQDDPKKPYALETRKASGKNLNVSLLGMPADDDWVLIASHRDKSLMRNFLAYSTARWLGRYAPRTRLVELAVNNRYEGVYLLAEDLKVHDDRVAVDDSDLSGGYLLEMISQRRAEGRVFFTTPVQSLPVLFKDPNAENISNGRAFWIRDYVRRFERRLYSDRFRDRRRGYRRYLDMGAAVDYVLLNELFRNADTFRNSTYMHKGVGEKLALGPLWDFDHAIGNDGDAEDNLLEGWQYLSRPNTYLWAQRLYAHRGFRRRMATRWETLRQRGLLGHIKRTIDSGAGQLAGGPQERNFARWPGFGRHASHAQAVDYLKSWVVRRARWIDRNVDSFQP